MKQKKKIDDIYREGLKNAKVPPPADSWEFISAHLLEEKKERLLPVWIKFAGVAALIALLLTVFKFSLFDSPLSQPVVNQEEKVNASPASEITPEAESRISNTEIEEREDLNIKNTSEAVAAEGSSHKATSNTGKDNNTSSATERRAVKNTTTNITRIASEERTAVVENPEEPVASEEENNLQPARTLPPAKALAATPEASEIQKTKTTAKKDISRELSKEETALAETETAAPPTKNEGFLKRLRISTTAGAVYFNTGNNNTVNAQLGDNGGGSDVSMAYGVNLAYNISERVKIRSGVSKVNFNYSTQSVDYSAASSSSAVRTDPAGKGIMLAAQGDLEQEFGFIEIPVEIEFSLIDKKIGLNLIGGASTLLLDENNLSMNTPAFTTDFGEAQNLNELSFSANLGLGVQYKFTPKIRLNLEPMFKYQLNTFDHGNSHYFGIYSGLSYQF